MRSPLPFARRSRNRPRSDDTRSHLLVEGIEDGSCMCGARDRGLCWRRAGSTST